MTVPLSIRIAAGLLWLSGFGLGIPCVLAIRSLRAGRGIARVMGYPAYGEGPFERHGLPTTVPLLVAFLFLCLIEIVGAVPLWEGRRIGAMIALVTIPIGAVFWWGFSLPYPPLLAIVRVILIVAGWRALT